MQKAKAEHLETALTWKKKKKSYDQVIIHGHGWQEFHWLFNVLSFAKLRLEGQVTASEFALPSWKWGAHYMELLGWLFTSDG